MRYFIFFCLIAALTGGMPSDAASPQDLLFQSVCGSFWTQPVSSDAQYEAFQVSGDPSPGLHAKYFVIDVNYQVLSNNSLPATDLYVPGSWLDRDSGKIWLGRVNLPADFVVPDATPQNQPNNPTVVYNTDTGTATMLNGIARPLAGGPIWGYRLNPQCSHAGSGLSGGEITQSEMQQGDINHAVAIVVWGKKYLSREGGGYVPPATRADNYYNNPLHPNYYNGPIPNLRMGSRLAIPRDVTASQLGLTTNAGQVLFNAFQRYGAYIIDNTGWDALYISTTPEAKGNFSHSTEDMKKLFGALRLVR